jgi:hypothetical protein
MNFFKSKRWPFGDILLLKLYCVVLGIIIGGYISSVVKGYLWLFIIVAVVMAVRLCYFYFLKED